ncbi:M24 family metallopeptidase [Salinisphaera sp. SPP-AMP-43]|uniref:M24 family metallopeptidase n=1 Tax=Salinisphaera sp. SPP-AMP-43 TaxID=3121288 RepID=UPI003C6DCA25
MSQRLETLRQAMPDWGIDALILNSRENVAWLTEGATYYVVERSEAGVASLLITAEGVYLVAPDNEIDRLLAEEPCPFVLEPATYPWYGDENATIRSIIGSARLGSDMPRADARDIGSELLPYRFALNVDEREKFAALGQDAAAVVEAVARRLIPGQSEREVEAEILHDCLALGIRPVCTLVAFDDRIDRFPHPIPTGRRLAQRCLITLGAERHGLNVSLTRLVHFGEPDPHARQVLAKLAEVHAETYAVLQPGLGFEDLFAAITDAYAQVGVVDGWRRHHQGGPAGYGCRDLVLTPGTTGQVVANQAFAFNPTLPGSKSEDTGLLTDGGIQWLTRTGDWPEIVIDRQGQRWTFTDWLVREPATKESS